MRYDDLAARRADSHWLPTPVIAVADCLLVAPPDANYLYCLDRATGEIRWHVERGGSTYILAATDRHVWLGGEQVQLINVETGEQIWCKPAAEPSGRGVVSGDRIYLPTRKGLEAMNAMTGESIEVQQPRDPPALGNLLAFDNALYSTDVSGTRELPDMHAVTWRPSSASARPDRRADRRFGWPGWNCCGTRRPRPWRRWIPSRPRSKPPTRCAISTSITWR